MGSEGLGVRAAPGACCPAGPDTPAVLPSLAPPSCGTGPGRESSGVSPEYREAGTASWGMAPPPGPALPHLCPVVAEDAHHADGDGFVKAAPQVLAVEGEHEGDVLLTGTVDDGV